MAIRPYPKLVMLDQFLGTAFVSLRFEEATVAFLAHENVSDSSARHPICSFLHAMLSRSQLTVAESQQVVRSGGRFFGWFLFL